MDSEINIRNEIDADVDAISEVTVAAFRTLEITNQNEQFIIEALRSSKVFCPYRWLRRPMDVLWDTLPFLP